MNSQLRISMSEELLSPPKAAELAECHEDTVRRAIEFGYLPAQKVGRTWAIKPSDVQKWVDAGRPNHRRKSTRKSSSGEETPEEADESP
jgi:excisionase family DNA binding protein